jgi:hypothetical protein
VSTGNGQYFNSAFDSLNQAINHAISIQHLSKTNIDVVKSYPNVMIYSKNKNNNENPVVYSSIDKSIKRISPISDTGNYDEIYVSGGNNGLYAFFITLSEAIDYAKTNATRDDIFRPEWMKVWKYKINVGCSCFIGIRSLKHQVVWSSEKVENNHSV